MSYPYIYDILFGSEHSAISDLPADYHKENISSGDSNNDSEDPKDPEDPNNNNNDDPKGPSGKDTNKNRWKSNSVKLTYFENVDDFNGEFGNKDNLIQTTGYYSVDLDALGDKVSEEEKKELETILSELSFSLEDHTYSGDLNGYLFSKVNIKEIVEKHKLMNWDVSFGTEYETASPSFSLIKDYNAVCSVYFFVECKDSYIDSVEVSFEGTETFSFAKEK